MSKPFATKPNDSSAAARDPWHYWPENPPDPGRWTAVEWMQGDEGGPCDGQPNAAAVEELLTQERDGWLTAGVWWRPLT
jgi:hypothetical protein